MRHAEAAMSADYDPNEYPGRRFVQPAHDKYVAGLLKRLAELERKTCPTEAPEGKDFAAFTALQYAGKLVQAVAGWAIDHQAGLAMKGLSFVPLQPSGTKQHKEYLAALMAVDSHEHERAGGQLYQSFQASDPVLLRQLLLNLLRPNSGGFPIWLTWRIVGALEGLKFGESSPVFMPVETDAKVRLQEMRLQLEALCFVEYRSAKGMKKLVAFDQVARALGVDSSTLRGWGPRLRRNGLGNLEVARHFSIAKNFASHFGRPDADLAKNADQRFGDEALRALAKRYKLFKSERKQHTT
jgi:hypothetical protein